MIPSEQTRDEAARLLSYPIHFPDEFKQWMGDFITVNIPMIPFSHIFGAKINIARSGNYIAASESRTGTGYGDLTTVGPQLTNLADGKYLFAYGCKSRQTMSIQFNSVAVSDDDSIEANESGLNGGKLTIRTITNNNTNTVTLKYKAGTFQDRWLVAIRLGDV